MEDKILEVLAQSSVPLRPPEISLKVGFPKGHNTGKTVNPYLHKLHEEGKIVRLENVNGSNPHYAIASG